ncbi:MAG: winged helix-turn-helix domain-containing protein [Victivallales bacterium]|nr:winged helix-turn-helix domain-containing protein [Victivallales bacterium]
MSWIGDVTDYKTPVDLLEPEAGALAVPADGGWDWARIKALVEFALANPTVWRTIAAKLDDPGATQAEIARRVRVSQQTVSRHLRRLRFGPEEW